MRGQSTLEYTMFVVAAAAALIGMGAYIRRSIQANLKTVEIRINQDAVRAPQVGTPGDTPPEELPPEPPPPPDTPF